jgi:penicillin-binding protein 1A
VTIAAGSGLAIRTFGGLPGPADLQLVGRAPQATLLFDASDRPLSAVFRERRIDVPLSGVSPHLIHAIVAVEDRRFFQHGGLDRRRILAAAWHNLLQGRAAQGASTITQQLARLRFLTREKTLRRKLREMVVARRLERQYTKQEILESYLNQVYSVTSGGAGRRALASLVGRADLAQAALLAGLVQAPSRLAPTADLHRAVERRNVVLRTMVEQALIDEPAWATARQAPVVLRDGLGRHEPAGGHFVEQVRRELMDRFGAEEVYERGLRVYTTLDLTMQRAAERAVTGTLRAIEARQAAAGEPTRDDSGGPLQASLVAVDPSNGEIRALVGGRDFAASRFNRAVHALRQPGSAFKPIVYAAAIEAGYSPASVLDQLDRPVAMLRGAWLPEDGRASTEAITMRRALRVSSNRAAVRMLDIVGIPSVVSQAARLGLGRMPPVPALALGAGEVTLLSMTMAYAAFADQVGYIEPIHPPRGRPRRRVLFESRPSPVPRWPT